MSRLPYRRRRDGFTLVELLVVVIIIGILAALLIPVINTARNTSRRATIAMELSQLESAIEQYKTNNANDYPADWSDTSQVKAHLGTAFNRHDRAATNTWIDAQNPTNATGKIDPAEALVFWLSLVYKDSFRPLTSSSTSKSVYFDFRPERLRDLDGDGFNEYYPPANDIAPYVYFHNRTYATASYPDTARYQGHTNLPGMGQARPYASGVSGMTTVWIEPTKFQILTTGLDFEFGGAITPPPYKIAPSPSSPSGANLTKGDGDNLTSFGKGKVLEDLRQ